MKRALVFAALLLGCATPRPLPPVQAGHDSSDDALQGSEAAQDPLRQQYADQLAQCEIHREQLQEEVDGHRRRENNLGAAAVVATIIGEAADVSDDSDTPNDGIGGQHPCPQDPTAAGPCPRPTLDTGAGSGSPARIDTEQASGSARSRVRAINTAIDRSDAFLFSRSASEDWSDEEHERWDELAAELDRLCNPSPPAPAPTL